MNYKPILIFFVIASIPLSSCSSGKEQSPSFPQKSTWTPIQATEIVHSDIIKSTATPKPTSSIALMVTASPSLTATPDFCDSSYWQDHKILVLENNLFDLLEPGGPNTFNRILIDQNQAWEDFRQEIDTMVGKKRYTAGQIFSSFAWGTELGTGVNPAVLLVTYGVVYDWALPADGDLAFRVDQIRGHLHDSWVEVARREVDISSEYPQVANGATYTLYQYFNGDLVDLENWCQSFIDVFGVSPYAY